MKQLLVLVFVTCYQFTQAGTTMPVKMQIEYDLKTNCQHQSGLGSSFGNEEIASKKDYAGSKTQERYYMKNTLNVLKKPLYACNNEFIRNLNALELFAV